MEGSREGGREGRRERGNEGEIKREEGSGDKGGIGKRSRVVRSHDNYAHVCVGGERMPS